MSEQELHYLDIIFRNITTWQELQQFLWKPKTQMARTLSYLCDQNDDLNGELNDMEGQYIAEEEAKCEAIEERDEMAERVNNLEEALEESEDERNQLKVELSELQDEFEVLKEELTDITGEWADETSD